MKLTPEAIKDFQEAYKKDFGEDISPQEAEEIGSSLINLMKVIYRPIPTNKK